MSKRKFSVAMQLTFPTLKIVEGKEHNVIVLDVMTKPDVDSKTGKVKLDDDGVEKTITIMKVDNLERDDGVIEEIVVNKVLGSVMAEAGIVKGNAIQFVKFPKGEGKSYNTFSVALLKLEAPK